MMASQFVKLISFKERMYFNLQKTNYYIYYHYNYRRRVHKLHLSLNTVIRTHFQSALAANIVHSHSLMRTC